MGLWGFIVMAIFVCIGISILYYCCSPNKKVRTERWNRLRRRRREDANSPPAQTLPVFTINTANAQSTGLRPHRPADGGREQQTVVRIERSGRPNRTAPAAPESDLPPSYSEAVAEARPNRY